MSGNANRQEETRRFDQATATKELTDPAQLATHSEQCAGKWSRRGHAMALAPFRRLPSQLFRDKGLVPDTSQVAALDAVDRTARELTEYVSARRQYTVARRRVERHVSAEAARLHAAARGSSYAWSRFQRAFGRSIEARLHDYEASALVRERCPPPPDPPRGVYLCGEVGVGKTEILNALRTSSAYACPVDTVVTFHYTSLIRLMHERLHVFDYMSAKERREHGWAHAMDAILPPAWRKPWLLPFPERQRGIFNAAIVRGTGGLLCVDEFQLADVADARLLQECLSRVMEHGFAVAMTSNRFPHEHDRQFLHNVGYRGFLDFLDERCAVQRVGIASTGMSSEGGSTDYREKMFNSRDMSAQSIFPSSDPKSTRQLRNCWRDVAGCEWDEVVQVTVQAEMGRVFLVSRASPSMTAAQFSLNELVHADVGPGDYEALARRFRLLLITDLVPPINESSRGVAQRWVWLIDALYNHGARLSMRIRSEGIVDAFLADRLMGRDRFDVAEGAEFEAERARLIGQAADASRPSGRASSMSALYTDEGERFALRRAASRLLEMQTTQYRRRGGTSLQCL
jgi:predicted ATPase